MAKLELTKLLINGPFRYRQVFEFFYEHFL